MNGRVNAGGSPDIGPVQLTGVLRGSVWAVAAATMPDGTVVVAAGDSHGKVAWWNAGNGDLLDEARFPNPSVIRSITAVELPEGRIWFAAGDGRGTVQLWDANDGRTVAGVIASETGPVWSMSALTVPGQATVLFTGGDDGKIRRWNVETGAEVGEPFGDQVSAVRGMTIGAQVDGRPVLVTGTDDGTVCRWDAETGHRLGPPMRNENGGVWGIAVAKVRPPGTQIVVSCSNDGSMCRWDDTGARLGRSVIVGPGALTGVVAVTLPTGYPALICSGTNGQLSCWNASTGEAIGRPVQASDGGALSLAAVPTFAGTQRLAVGGANGTVTVAPVEWAAPPRTSASAQLDATRIQDRLGRRILAAHLGELLSGLATHSDSTSAVVHVDGQWGSGKSTLVRLLLDDAQPHGPDWTPPLVVDYEAWRECAIAPEWWSLAAAIERAVRRSRSRVVRPFMHVWSAMVRTVRSPATLTALAVAVGGGLVSTVLPPSWTKATVAVAAAVGGLIGIGQVLGRTLFWHSAPFGRLHLHTEDNPLGQVADMISWLRRWTPRVPPGHAGHDRRRPILLVIDDLDRCPAERVVKILETVHTILRQPQARSLPHRREPARLLVLVLADGQWVRQAFTTRFADFQNPGSTVRDIGSDFIQKLFDHVVLVPDLFADQTTAYLDDVLQVRANENETGAAIDNTSLRKETPASTAATPPVRDQESVQIERVRQEASPAAADARRAHLLHTYTSLMPANPRMIKRIVNVLGMLLAIKTHVGHTEDEDAMARAAILLVRFPGLAARLRRDDLLNGADPWWELPGVRDVVGSCGLESLARCLGRANPSIAAEG